MENKRESQVLLARREPKTDYTYSRSVSYNNVKGGKIYVSPNMSRRRIHGDSSLLGSKESPQKMSSSTHWLRSREKVTDFSTPQHNPDDSISNYLSENLHNEHLEDNQHSSVQNSSSIIHRRRSNNLRQDTSNTKTVTKITNTVTEIYDLDNQMEKGMKEANTSKSVNESHALSSSSSVSPASDTREFRKETVTTDYIIKDRSADIYNDDKTLHYGKAGHIGSRYRQQSTSSYENNSAAYNKNESAVTSENSSGYYTQSSNTSQKRFLAQKMASAAAALCSAGSYFTKDKTTTVQHMYGLDSDTEYDYDELCGKSDMAKASVSGNYSVSSPYYTGAKQSTAATSTAPRGGFFWTTARGAKSLCTKTVTTTMEIFEWLTIGTVHKLGSVVTSRRWCCCCLPLLLLLLLPLLLSGLWAIAGLSENNSTTIINKLTILPFVRKPDTIVIGQTKTSESHLALEKQVQLLILQMQETRAKQDAQLSRTDVEAMIKSMSTEQLTTLMGHLDQNDRKQNEQLDSWKKEQLIHFEAMNEKMKLLMAKAESLNSELLTTTNSLESQSSISGENKNKLSLLEESLQTLVGEFSHLKNFQHEYYNLFKNCCKNATAIRSNIKEEVYAALVKVLGGNVDGDSGTSESVVQQTLMTWLRDNYISRSELDSHLGVLAKTLTKKLQDMLAKEKPNATVYLSGGNSDISESFIRGLIDEAIVKFSADKTGMADFALESGGGSVISTRCSETYTKKTALVSMFGIPLFYKSNSPRTAIQPDVNPGECWAFKGNIGTLVIQLSRKIKITAFSMEHIHKSISPHGRIDSAPKDFSVYSLLDGNDQKGICLGNYTYKDNGQAIQQFPVQVENTNPTQLVEVRISSNHGNLEFTCLYRFRVHGVPDSH